jgi:hypothetical protein
VQVQQNPNPLSDKFKERYQDKIIDKFKVTRFLTKQASFDKKIRQIPNSRFLQDFTFQVTKTTVQIPQSSYCFFTFQALFKLPFWLVEGTSQFYDSISRLNLQLNSVSQSKSPVNTFLPFQQTKPSLVFPKLSQSHL